MARTPQQLEQIRQFCRSRDLDEEDTFYITKRLLEHYRNALWMNGGITGGKNSILQGEGKEEVRQWYLKLRNMSMEEVKSIPIDSMIFHVCRTDWILRVINVVMERVKSFHNSGELYFEILERIYFSERRLSDQEVADELALERSTYYRRKKEAILLCGVLLWEEAWTRKFA